VIAAINEAQRFFALLTLCLETTGTQALAAATPTYRMLTIFEDWLLPLRVRVFGAGGGKVASARLADLDALNPAWQNEAGAPARYAALGFDFVALHPRPTLTGTSLEWIYAKFPARMSAAGASPEIPEEYHQVLVDYAIPTLRAKEGGQGFLDSLLYLDRFLEAAQKEADYVRTRNKSQLYDRGPFELKSFDRSRLIGEIKKAASKGKISNG
jgi:hypothetical protein